MRCTRSTALFFNLLFVTVCVSVSRPVNAELPANQLSKSESLGGWQLLFDGQSTDGWRNYKKENVSDGWKVRDGVLTRVGKGAGDLITKKKYKYFDLLLEYQISKGGNSGLMFRVTEDNPSPWQSGPEIQIQDNVAGTDPQTSGTLYQLYEPILPGWLKEGSKLQATRPVGQWNQLFLRVGRNQCEVSLNGVLYYRFDVGNNDWNERVRKSKFAKYPEFAKTVEGYLCLQDHGDQVSFRNIKIRELPADGSIPQPIDGKIDVKVVSAFPKLKWEGWEAESESGIVNKPLRILELTPANDGSNRLFAIEQRGWVFAFENKPDVEQASLVLDLQEKANRWSDNGREEEGLLGLAVHPDFKNNRQLFVCYTKRENDHCIIARYRMDKDGRNKIDPQSEEVLLDIDHPYQNHNGGSMEFGPDGYLYVGFGDGGSGYDPKANGQNRGQLLGSIIRIDVNSRTDGMRYGIPRDNPFMGIKGVRPEIYAHGLRNPWRISFDKATGRLWCGDVGQEIFEEVNVIVKGGNYGWSNREGTHPFGNRPPVDGVSEPIDPVWEYDHSTGKSITGGRVYNLDRIPELKGKYLYADYISGSIWALTYNARTGKATRNEQVVEKGLPVFAFGEDQNGEIYFMRNSAVGQCIYRFAPNSESAP